MTETGQTTRAELASLLRSCVQCGQCLPHCATWLATGNEVQSPRGRLLLLEEVLNTEDPDSDIPLAFLKAFDQCIGCRACETACPSGVPFSLLKYGQELAGKLAIKGHPEMPQPAVPGFVLRRLDSPSTLRFLRRGVLAAKAIFSLVFGRRWRSRLDHSQVGMGKLVRLLGSLPTAPETEEELFDLLDNLIAHRSAEAEPVEAVESDASSGISTKVSTNPRLAFFQGCANQSLLPGSSLRLVKLLRSAGCQVGIPPKQNCCGALAAHTGRPDQAAALHQSNREAFAQEFESGSLLVVEAAGCGLELIEGLGEYGSKVIDAVDLLSELTLPPLGNVPLKVAVHDPCHARHGQKIFPQPREVLSRIPGVVLVEAPEAEVCCGSGGAWGLRYPGISEQLARRKAENFLATGADLVVTSNPGCLGQIADGLSLIAPDLPILPLTDLLFYAAFRHQYTD